MNYSKVLGKQMGQVVVHSTVSVPHLMLVTLCKAYPEQFSLAPLLLEGLDRWVIFSRVRKVFIHGCKWPLHTVYVLGEEGGCRHVSRGWEHPSVAR